MMQNQWALLKRELWENPSIYVAPIVIGIIVSLLSVTGQFAVSELGEAVDIAILGATNLTSPQRSAMIMVVLTSVSSLFVLGMGVLTTFYSLDALYAERKDKSILFWRSIPLTDAETVISKLLTAIVVIPLVTFALIAMTHLVVLAVSSIWVGFRGANAWYLVWQSAPLFDNWASTLIFLFSLQIWMSPFVGWFLLVSGYTKRSPFLMAFLPIIILPMLERILFGTSLLKEAFFGRIGGLPIFDEEFMVKLFSDDHGALKEMAESGVSLLSLIDVPGYLASPGLWLGLIGCGLFTTAAIYVRRYRDES